ncbi:MULTISPECIES: amino acid adenylation domain-containing protein [unclassified Pseudoalteromonas]|uniref:amino acid adenylation domain-containing protein n=1 Tax=unclassified Pseudoalteromonas TaxID=194690 RepID=UPI0025B350A5|nr:MULTISPECIES: amino acid adenylation domain-containing protein [unclassified Pseudoalteromonas]MDN3379170.1 amino acid adenylation domain-containing protein [Pseudoalteromonas sp. APC 3893]MDN3387665.1 amino acid adenylation domain-containing protein [Pseudoalteromonas sp. APC 4017]
MLNTHPQSINKTLIALFEEQVTATPNHLAVKCGEEYLTYRQLDERANQLANYLVESGVSRNHVVGLLLERSVEMSVALLGALKAGACYMPIDSTSPIARIRFITQDADVKLIISASKFSSTLIDLPGVSFLKIDDEQSYLEQFSTQRPNSDSQLTDAVYLLYTSGSSGEPKGCILENAAVVNRILWMQKEYPITPEDRVIQKTPYTFDVSVWELFWPLLVGASLIYAKPNGHRDSVYLRTFMRDEHITVCHFVPTMLKLFLERFDGEHAAPLKYTFLSGEALDYELVDRALTLLPGQVINLYGPTEAAIDVTYWLCQRRSDKKIPIGKPIDNIRIYIVDEELKAVPQGTRGEICIAGVGLAKGYLNRTELTQKVFVDAPRFLEEARMYRTGDYGLVNGDGEIEYLGRIDSQYKLRGQRIELGEIEHHLSAHPAIQKTAVAIKDDDSIDPKLVAYMVADVKSISSLEPINSRDLRNFLSERLPAHMLPNLFHFVDEFPVSKHGKLDLAALPWPLPISGSSESAESAVTSSSKMSSKDVGHYGREVATLDSENSAESEGSVEFNQVITSLRTFLSEQLNHHNLDIARDLFSQGASSLTLAMLAEEIQQTFGLVIPIDQVLQLPTITEVARLVVGNSDNAAYQTFGLQQPVTNTTQLKQEPSNKSLPQKTQPTDQVQTSLESELRNYLSTQFNDTGFGLDDSLFELGATSLSIMNIMEWLQQNYGAAGDIEEILARPTLRTLLLFLELDEAMVNKQVVTNKQKVISENEVDNLGRQSVTDDATTHETVCLPKAKLSLPKRSRSTNTTDSALHSSLLRRLSNLLEPLATIQFQGEEKYHYSSSGGLNSVQCYLWVAGDSAQEIAEGYYYYHPVKHALYAVNKGTLLPEAAFHHHNSALLSSSDIALFFVAEFKAIAPLYYSVAAPLTALETGYMMQLLRHRLSQPQFDFVPVAIEQPEILQQDLRLSASQSVIAAVAFGYDKKIEPSYHKPHSTDNNRPSFWKLPAELVAEKDIVLDPKIRKQIQDAQHQLKYQQKTPSIKLTRLSEQVELYQVRKSIRQFTSQPLTLEQLAGLSAMIRLAELSYPMLNSFDQKDQKDVNQDLGSAFTYYLYLKQSHLVGESDAGIYQLDIIHGRMSLQRVDEGSIEQQFIEAYSPANRATFKNASAALFMVANPSQAQQKLGADYLMELHLRAGFIGQFLLQHLAEFGLGACPIGGMIEKPLRYLLPMNEPDILVHSFILGGHKIALPASYLPLSTNHKECFAKRENLQPANNNDIAIIGTAIKLPGAESLTDYWCQLSSSEPLPMVERDGVESYLIADVYQFDNLRFGIAPAEARGMDPQERMLLQSAWSCVEDAGYCPAKLEEHFSEIGVFIGAMWDDYKLSGVEFWNATNQVTAFSSPSSLANRISYHFNCRGPSITVNTSCSSGISALHIAAEYLVKSNHQKAALVGGVNLLTHRYHYQLLNDLQLLSQDNIAKPFSQDATGWVVGEGVGTFLLRPLSAAIKANDNIYGVIEQTRISHTGKVTRYTAPNAQGQKQDIEALLEAATLTCKDVSYVEAGAPGASLADASEFKAIHDVFVEHQATGLIGSVKGKVGHLESASVIAQVAKVLLQFKHQCIFQSHNSDQVSSLIDTRQDVLKIASESQHWGEQDLAHETRRALVCAHGATGSSGYLLLRNFNQPYLADQADVPVVLLYSAPTQELLAETLKSQLNFLQTELQTERQPNLLNYAFSVTQIFTEQPVRIAVVAANMDQLCRKIVFYLSGETEGQVINPEQVINKDFNLTEFAMAWQSLQKNNDALKHYLQQFATRRIRIPGTRFEQNQFNLPKVEITAKSSDEFVQANTMPETQLKTASFNKAADNEANYKVIKETGMFDTVLAKKLLDLYSFVSEIPRDRISLDTSFSMLGLNSILIKQMCVEIKHKFGLAVPTTLFYECDTLAEIAAYLERLPKANEPSITQASTSSLGNAADLHQTEAHQIEPRSLQNNIATDPLTAGTSESNVSSRDIAVVGVAGRYPKSQDVYDFWDNLLKGNDCISRISAHRLNLFATAHGTEFADWLAKNRKIEAGFLDQVECFDPMFFGIAPSAAASMDPQSRQFLQVAWATLEDAGYTPENVAIKRDDQVGVFVGVMYGEYQLYHTQDPDFGFMQGQASLGSLAHHVSYYLNFNGPSIAIDTMCSSSLTAIHLACQSLNDGDCQAAICGGVNLSLHPSKFIIQKNLGMTASDFRCKAFADAGDGFVSSEGVGAVLLKRRDRAVEDKDQIYAVIKASSINSAGKTAGYTVPNPNAQAELVIAALKRANLSSQQINYIEAHGTGTELGDPIEISGLNKAFAATQPKEASHVYCDIGSVKSNIGHCEGAAGIAGLTKILLQLKYQQLVPSIHSQPQNKNIDFSSSFFQVKQQLEHWSLHSHQDKRRALLLSFGAGGANGCLVIEEYPQPDYQQQEGPHKIRLSADSEAQLKYLAKKLLVHINRENLDDRHLSSIAFTLMTGRQLRAYHWEIEVNHITELKNGLTQVIEANNSPLILTRDQAKAVHLDENRYLSSMGVYRINLPTYPFSEEAYWLSFAASAFNENTQIMEHHPSAAEGDRDSHLNCSNNMSPLQQKTLTNGHFVIQISETHPIVAAHKVQGNAVVPATLLMEVIGSVLTTQAILKAEPSENPDHLGRSIELSNVVFVRPLSAKGNLDIQVLCQPIKDGLFTVSLTVEQDNQSNLHMQCLAKLSDGAIYGDVSTQGKEPLNIQAFKLGCNRQINADEHYQLYTALGIDYGKPLQGVKEIYLGQGANGEAIGLATLTLPENTTAPKQANYRLNPALLDSALQCVVALLESSNSSGLVEPRLALPYEVGCLQVHKPMPDQAYALISKNRVMNKGSADTEQLNFTIEILDSQGYPCVTIRDFICRCISPSQQQQQKKAQQHELRHKQEPLAETSTINNQTATQEHVALNTSANIEERNHYELTPLWQPISPEENHLAATTLVLHFGEPRTTCHYQRDSESWLDLQAFHSVGELVSAIGQLPEFNTLVLLPVTMSISISELARREQRLVAAMLDLVKALVEAGRASQELNWKVFTTLTQKIQSNDIISSQGSALWGFLGSVMHEYPHWNGLFIDLSANTDDLSKGDWNRIVGLSTGQVGWRNQVIYQRQLCPVNLSEPTLPSLAPGEVCLVIGGAGGLGQVFTDYIIQRYDAQIVWLGRRKVDSDIDQKLERYSTANNKPIYIQADGSDPVQLKAATNEIQNRFNLPVKGVVHSAITLKDKSVEQLQRQELIEVFSSKVGVSTAIAEVFGQWPLNFVLFFSSTQSFLTAPGQANYAAGCTFKDALAYQLHSEFGTPVKIINWGYWGNIGIVSGDHYRDRMQKMGILPLISDASMKVMDSLIGSSCQQLLVMDVAKSIRFPGVVQHLNAVAQPLTGAHQNTYDWRAMLEKFDTKFVPEQSVSSSDTKLVVQLICQIVARKLCDLGPNKEHRLKVIAPKKLPMMPKFQAWLTETLRQLVMHEVIVEQANGEYHLSGDNHSWSESEVWQKIEAMNHVGESGSQQLALIKRVLSALGDILLGHKMATEALFSDGHTSSVTSVYQGNRVSDYCNSQLALSLTEMMRQKLSKQPDYRFNIVEIGAGTGSTTEAVLRHLEPLGQHIDSYWFTDISQAFLNHADNRYSKRFPFLKFAHLNVEKILDVGRCGKGHFDFLVATNVLHATRNIRHTIHNVKSLLTGGGCVLINEISENTLFAHLTFGLLDGWWLFDDPEVRIQGAPILSRNNWHKMIAEAGFHSINTMTDNSETVRQFVLAAQSDGVIIEDHQISENKPVETKQLNNQTLVQEAVMEPSGEQAINQDKTELTHVVIDSVAKVLRYPKEKIDTGRAFSEYGVDSIVAVNLINIINRSVELNLPTTVVFDYPNVKALVDHISEFKSNTLIQDNTRAIDYTLAIDKQPQRNDVVSKVESKTPHSFAANLVSNPQRLSYSSPTTVTKITESIQPPNSKEYCRYLITGPGEVEDLVLERLPIPELAPEQVLVAVKAFSLNFADILCVKGMYPNQPAYPFSPGFEVSGIVIAVGSDQVPFVPGDEVVALTGEQLGGHANAVICHHAQLNYKNDRLSFSQACAFPTVALTVIHGFNKANIQPGEKVLIQSATGGTGQVAIQLAKYFGAEVIVTCGSDEKVAYLKRQGITHAVNYCAEDFQTYVMACTQNRGVDVVLNTLGEDAISKGMACLADGGRYIELSMTAIKGAKSIDFSVLSDNQSIFSVDLRRLGMKHPQMIQTLWQQLEQYIDDGVIVPTVNHEFTFADIADAYRLIMERKNLGKVMVTVPDQLQIKTGTAELLGRAATSRTKTLDIAIIGMSGKFSSADNIEQYWDNLAQGKDLVEKAQRWSFTPEQKNDPAFCSFGSFIDGIGLFDPKFFNMSGIEARNTDPQQRLTLEQCWFALEDAGYAGDLLNGKRCGVYSAYAGSDYGHLLGDGAAAQAFWGNSGSILAARISYFLNLKGPAIAIDTACSSSLVALDMAARALRNQEIEMAIVTAMFVQSTAGFFLSSNNAKMLSSTGKCYTFDERADGFVPGEGGGALLLKRLEQAQSDRDHIYAVIRGSGVNQDGATNGITAPSSNSQYELLTQVYTKHGISPTDIDLVEAHGTGTRLGDPIEMGALNRAFSEFTDKKHFCAIGSVKSNLGHAAHAAGMAGLLKLLLSFQHQAIPASINFATPNQGIDFDNSPFFVNTQLTPWPKQTNGPRLAAISSFGFSGTNAHIVLSDHHQPPVAKPSQQAELIVVSAASIKQLRQLAADLKNHCDNHPELLLANIGFTLGIGRRHMRHRLALVCSSLTELSDQIGGWLQQADGSAGSNDWQRNYRDVIFSAQIDESNESALSAEASQLLTKISQVTPQHQVSPEHQKPWLAQLAQKYVMGAKIDWQTFFGKRRLYRVSLPRYPFSRDVYWVQGAGPKFESTFESTFESSNLSAEISCDEVDQRNIKRIEQGHPYLVAQQDERGQFRCQLMASHPLFTDHQIHGKNTLPGSASVELALAAIHHRSFNRETSHFPYVIESLKWLQPITHSDSFSVVVNSTHSNQPHDFKVYKNNQSLVATAKVTAATQGLTPKEWLALPDTRVGFQEVTGESLYALLSSVGLCYGESFRAVKHLALGKEQVVSRLSLPQSGYDSEHQHLIVHPGLLDAVLHSCSLLVPAEASDARFLASGIERLEIFAPCKTEHWAHIRRVENDRNHQVQCYDIDVMDINHQLVLSIKGFKTKQLMTNVTRPSESQVKPSNTNDFVNSEETTQINLSLPTWGKITLNSATEKQQKHQSKQVLLIGGGQKELNRFTALAEQTQQIDFRSATNSDSLDWLLLPNPQQIILLPPPLASLDSFTTHGIEADSEFLLRCFRLIKAFAQSSFASQPLEWLLMTQNAFHPALSSDHIEAAHAAAHGLFGVAAREQHQWKIATIDCDGDYDQILNKLIDLSAYDYPGQTLACYHGQWQVQSLKPAYMEPTEHTPYQQKGCYLIVGGSGGIGQQWSRMLAKKYSAHLIWLGRSAYNPAIASQIQAVEQLGGSVEYFQVDVGDWRQLNAFYQERFKNNESNNIQSTNSAKRLNGVIHSAVGDMDHRISEMDESQLSQSLRIKMSGFINLVRIMENQSLDFMLLFSSTAAYSREHGKCGYVASSLYMDRLAVGLADQVHYPIHVVNWGWWGKTGIADRVSHAHKVRASKLGIAEIDIDDAVEAVNRQFQSKSSQVYAIKMRSTTDTAYSINSGYWQLIENVTQPCLLKLPDEFESTLKHALSTMYDSETTTQLQQQAKLQAIILNATLHYHRILEQGDILDNNCLQKFIPWLKTSLDLLKPFNFEPESEDYPNILATAWQQWTELENQLVQPQLSSQMRLVEKMLRALPDILTGKLSATSVMFEKSSTKLVEGIYAGNKPAEVLNSFQAKAIINYVAERIKQGNTAPIKILEVGAGTGGLTKALVELLIAESSIEVATYCFTDVSKAFLEQAKLASFIKSFPVFEFKSFNLEQTPQEQGIDTGAFDLVLASNVLHACKNMGQVLANIKPTLKRNGRLFLTEINQASMFNQLTFGLLDDWWNYDDGELRESGCPALSSENWFKILAEAGFKSPKVYGAAFTELGQQYISAVSDGWIFIQNDEARGGSNIVSNVRSHLGSHVNAKINTAKEPQLTPSVKFSASENAAISKVQLEEQIRNQCLDNTLRWLIPLFADVLGLNESQIDEQEPFEHLGMDSILIENLTHEVKAKFSSVTTADFFACRNILQYANKLAALSNSMVNGDRIELLENLHEESQKINLTEKTATDKQTAPQTDLRSFIISAFANTVGIDDAQIDLDEPMMEFGLDSILVEQFVSKVREEISGFSNAEFFNCRTIQALCQRLEEQFANQVNDNFTLDQGIVDTDVSYEFSEDGEWQDNETSKTQMTSQSPSSTESPEASELIAIIGMTGKFPGAANLTEYWENLSQGRSTVTEVPLERWALKDFYVDSIEEAVAKQKSYCKWGGFLTGFDEFDCELFQVTPKEALNLDPQERLFLQTCWEVIEDAGYTRHSLQATRAKVGVFVGITKNDYNLHGPELWQAGEKIFPHTSFSSVANRVSYFFGFNGPSMPIDTMCSSSLTAVHEACQHLKHGDCSVAIAGGVNLYLHKTGYVALCAMQMLAKDAKCKSFGAAADGFVPAEGVGAVLLKPLSAAQADRDNIRAVIRATGINHGGQTNGFTVPSPTAQGELIYDVLSKAKLKAGEVSYIEAHGTGTRLGDPIEIQGLTQAFEQRAKDTGEQLKSQQCLVGSVKSNFGHAESAAGIASLIKTVLQIEHCQIAPSLHAENLNPQLNLPTTPFQIARQLSPWHGHKIAGVSSFGAGGANAHIILEQYQPVNELTLPSKNESMATGSDYLFLLSAPSTHQLTQYAERWISALAGNGYQESDLVHMAYTSQVGRETMSSRLAIIADSLATLKSALKQYLANDIDMKRVFVKTESIDSDTLSLLQQQRMQQLLIQDFMAGKYVEIAGLWSGGMNFDWFNFHQRPNVPYCRVSLPTLPFKETSFWLNKTNHAGSSNDDDKVTEILKRLQDGHLSIEEADELISLDAFSVVQTN